MWRYFAYGILSAFVILAIVRLIGLSEASWGISIIASIAIGVVLGFVWLLVLRKKTPSQEE
jgi:hypothetical protein